tara:strand:- start:89 stop:379 length:291 start_codon:yes stop_codon:yes gene_type:complete
MKITKSKLKEIILEELELSEQEQEKLSGSDARAATMDAAKKMTASGIDDEERGAIIRFIEKLQRAAAEEGVLTSGTLMQRMKQMEAELDKIIGEME